MKRILEYRVFDILKDPENAKFLDRVKKENPDLYSKFLNLVGNKGLEKAKERYVKYDPEFVKLRKEKEEEEKREREREKRAIRNFELYKENEKEIRELENILDDSELKIIANKIKATPLLDKLFGNLKKQYVGEIRKKLKDLSRLDFELNILSEKINLNYLIDTLSYHTKGYNFYNSDYRSIVVFISQNYRMKTKELYYNIRFTTSLDTILNYKITEFGLHISDYINHLSEMNITKEELYGILFVKIPYIYSDEYYKKWKKQYDLEQDINKYNL